MPAFDTVVHFADVPRLLQMSDNECYQSNTIGTYNVINATVKMGVPNVIVASSETTYGMCFANGEMKPDYELPNIIQPSPKTVIPCQRSSSKQQRGVFKNEAALICAACETTTSSNPTNKNKTFLLLCAILTRDAGV